MRPILLEVVATLLRDTREGEEVSLDRLGGALDHVTVMADEVDAIIDRLEAAGRVVGGSPGPLAETDLRVVLPAIRKLKAGGKVPDVDALAAETKLESARVRRALLLARFIGR